MVRFETKSGIVLGLTILLYQKKMMTDIERFEKMEERLEGNPRIVTLVTVLGSIFVLYGLGFVFSLF